MKVDFTAANGTKSTRNLPVAAFRFRSAGNVEVGQRTAEELRAEIEATKAHTAAIQREIAELRHKLSLLPPKGSKALTAQAIRDHAELMRCTVAEAAIYLLSRREQTGFPRTFAG